MSLGQLLEALISSIEVTVYLEDGKVKADFDFKKSKSVLEQSEQTDVKSNNSDDDSCS